MTDTPTTETPLLVEASVAFLLEHRSYPGCTMASLTIRERLEVIEAEARAAGRAEALRRVEALEPRDFTSPGPSGWFYDGFYEAKEAALAVIRDTPEET